MLGSEDDDPLTQAMKPPKNETPEEKMLRLQAEAEASKQSALIDQQLKAERARLKKDAEKTHKILLLGTSHSPMRAKPARRSARVLTSCHRPSRERENDSDKE